MSAEVKDKPQSRPRKKKEKEEKEDSGKSIVAKSIVASSRWVLIDATGLVVGRLAAQVARLLRGKHNPNFAPYRDSGDHVIVVNTDKMHFTGKKRETKCYYRHTGYPGGIKSRSAKSLFAENGSTKVLRYAVKGMIPRGVLGRQQLRKLRLFCGAEHGHLAQQPEAFDFGAQNIKNSIRLSS